jgi:hypothetical protein
MAHTPVTMFPDSSPKNIILHSEPRLEHPVKFARCTLRIGIVMTGIDTKYIVDRGVFPWQRLDVPQSNLGPHPQTFRLPRIIS